MYKVQSVLFNKNAFTKEVAIDFIHRNGFKLKKIDETNKFYRFRQFTPAYLKKQGYNHVITKKMGGVEFIIFYKEGFVVEGGTISASQKSSIINNLSSITKEEALADYKKLREEVGCNGLTKISPLSKIGNKFVDFFTFPQRIETKGKTGMNFFDFWEKKSIYAKKAYIQKIIAFYKRTAPNTPVLKVWVRIFNLGFGSITIFRPLVAMGIYCRYKPTSVLDFTMGWGGRLVGACAVDVPKYIGIDLNPTLKEPYAKMIDMLKPLTNTKITIMFQDCLKVDYSKIDYDMVLTSPPYYNIEIYTGSTKQSKDDWDNNFYEPILRMTWTHLKKGGHYCLNVPKEVYERVCQKVLGNADDFIPLVKSQRSRIGSTANPNKIYAEFIYVWRK